MTKKGNTTIWEGYTDRDRDPCQETVALKIRVDAVYNDWHWDKVKMAGVFEEEFEKAGKHDQSYTRALIHQTHLD